MDLQNLHKEWAKSQGMVRPLLVQKWSLDSLCDTVKWVSQLPLSWDGEPDLLHLPTFP